LTGWGLRDVLRAQQTLLEIAESGLTLDLLAGLCSQLATSLPHTPDPDTALDAFRRYLFAVRSPLALAALLSRDVSAMPLLLWALSLGPQWAKLLIDDPEAFDLLRETEGQPLERESLYGEVLAEIGAFSDERAIVSAIGRIARRQRLRIAYGDLVLDHSLELVLGQLSLLTESLVRATLQAAQQKALEARPLPARVDPSRLPFAVLALDRLGAGEVDYALRMVLLLVHDFAADDAGSFRAVSEHFERVARLFARWLEEASWGEPCWRVHWMPLPDSTVTAAAHSVHDVALGLDSFGRTWHRQALLKARTIAGDSQLGASLLARLTPWLFRRYLSRADETGIKALKRRIVMTATLHQDDWRDVVLARGGLRDLESAVEFLQLLAGGDQPAVRQGGTRAALAGLAASGTIAPDERAVLDETYVYLRRLEHRPQLLMGLPVRELPPDDSLVARIARSLDAATTPAQFLADLQARLDRSWATLRKLLDSAFPEEPPTPREVELLLDPDPPEEEVRAALAPFGFVQPYAALAALNELAAEQVPFLSTRRCRHLLAAILPRLLCAVGATPDPDRTLDNLARVSNSLGGKAVLWELLRASPPSLQLYVRLCAASPYLSEILTTNPGMIDELVDSLQLDKLATREELQATLAELCRGVTDTLPVLLDFKNAQHVRIGVRDILAKEDIDRTHEALADVAETCLDHVVRSEYRRLVDKFGVPTIALGPGQGQPSRIVLLALGKLGSREPNYHSQLEVLFLYEAEGTTHPVGRAKRDQRTANNHFYTQLAQRVLKTIQQLTPQGRLYSMDVLLRPIGIGGALALSLNDFTQHFASGAAPLWQWQTLCQARPVCGEAGICEYTERLIHNLIAQRPRRDQDRGELRSSRLQLEKGAVADNLKRGPGGTLDVEFLVQMLQLENAAAHPQVLAPNVQEALTALAKAGVLTGETAERLGNSYRFLRRVECGLRLLNTAARHDLPAEPQQLAQLALLLGHSNPVRLREQCLVHMAENRAVFEQLLTLEP